MGVLRTTAGPLRHTLLALLGALVVACVSASPARAEETPTPVSHLVPYNLDWIAYIDPADAPPVRYAVCIVDTGINITPDTPPDDPVNGPILKRLATDGGPGTQQGGTDPALLHGTRMAFAVIAPQNNWGTVGVWPGGTAISVRSSINNETSLRPFGYLSGLSLCDAYSRDFPIAAVLWALACPGCAYTAEQRRYADQNLREARARGLSVVAAAGNSSGELSGPASLNGVVPVAGGAPDLTLCDDTASAPGILAAPSCPVQSADPLTGVPAAFANGGTSSAAASVAALMALLRSYRPSAGPERVEAWIADSARHSPTAGYIDGAEAARTAGLGALVDRAIERRNSARVVSAPVATSTPVATLTPGAEAVRAKPLADARLKKGRLLIRVRGWQPSLYLQVRFGGSGDERRYAFRRSRLITVRRSRLPRAILLRFLPSDPNVSPSDWSRLERSRDRTRYLQAR